MTTNSKIPPQKKVVSVEILHLENEGYGPYGHLRRLDWQEECMRNFKAGSTAFSIWQRSLSELEVADDKSNKLVRFGYRLNYDNNTTQDFNDRLSHRCTLDFVTQKFDKHIDISNYIFISETNFSYATFTGLVSFKNSIFQKNVNFYQTNFAGLIDFSEVTFEDSVNFATSFFTRTTFIGDYKLRVLQDVLHAPFSGSINFSNTVFKGQVDFSSVRFNVSVNFNDTKFKNRSIFSNAIFEEYANFENSYFYAVGHFEKVMFIRNIPNFLGVDNATTLLVFSADKYFNENDTTEDALKRIGQLKRLADEQGQTDQALMFNAFELNAKAKQPNASSLFKIFTWLYKNVSNYGRSFGRPIATYLGLVTITYLLALLAAANNSPQNCKGELWRVFSDWSANDWPSCLSAELQDDKLKLNGYRAAFEYTTYRAAGILDFSDNDKQTVAVSKRLFNADIEPTWMRFWGILKAIASAALLFLAALGLRNKYRIK